VKSAIDNTKNMSDRIVKYILGVLLCTTTALSIDNAIVDFTNQLEKTYQNNKDKIILSNSNESVKNNVKYLVFPNLYEYTKNYSKFFTNVENNDSLYLDSILVNNSVFDVFLYDTHLYIGTLRRNPSVHANAIDTIYTLQAVQMLTLHSIVINSQNYKQLTFAISHLNALFSEFDLNDSRTCELFNNYHDASLITFIKILMEGYSEYSNDTNESSFPSHDHAPLIDKKDWTLETFKFIDENVIDILEKENSIFINKFKTNYDNFDFLDDYLDKLHSEQKVLNDLEQKYKTKKASLIELKLFYSKLYANNLNILITELFEELLESYNKNKELLKKCSVTKKVPLKEKEN